ncbi:HupE/UreJ family protein [Ferruginibacter lapsinanis]|uniref:HupE/UreJ family protein n=1 Tax=Ferruginibacter lapsinanis TaxID=563172 RepID=UPI001E5723D7|nr:HupE/UreJ family protein [Ferruginibacter lapsinanis]UEG49408.1 HupE/UreJ family protein [Ferruginibacter lapsinanis]
MTPTIASNKLTYVAKAFGLLLLSVFLTQVLWSNISFTELAKVSRPNSSLALMQLGANHFSTLFLGHMVFVISLFLFNSKYEFVINQLLVFSLGFTIALWLNMFNVVKPSNYIIYSLVPLTTVYIAGENLFAYKLKSSRLIIVGVCGLIHGLAMAANLKETIVLPKKIFAKSLLMYNIGIELAIICFAIPAFLILMNIVGSRSFTKPFFKISSIVLIIFSLYWAIVRMA